MCLRRWHGNLDGAICARSKSSPVLTSQARRCASPDRILMIRMSRNNSFDDDARRGFARPAGGYCRPQIVRDADIEPGKSTIGFDGDDRAALVRRCADVQVERYFTEEWCADLLGLFPCTAVTEDPRDAIATRAPEASHILDPPEHRHIAALKHCYPASFVA